MLEIMPSLSIISDRFYLYILSKCSDSCAVSDPNCSKVYKENKGELNLNVSNKDRKPFTTVEEEHKRNEYIKIYGNYFQVLQIEQNLPKGGKAADYYQKIKKNGIKALKSFKR